MKAYYSPADGKRGVSAMTEDVAQKLIEQDDQINSLRSDLDEAVTVLKECEAALKDYYQRWSYAGELVVLTHVRFLLSRLEKPRLQSSPK